MPSSLPRISPLHALLGGGLALALASLLVLAPAPTYDPWAWLIWGRELWSGELHTGEGPAFKPLPVAICFLLAPLGDAAPTAWVLVARWGAACAVLLAAVLAARLGGVPRNGQFVMLSRHAPGVVAALGVVLTAGFIRLAGAGSSEGILLALALGALLAWMDGRRRLTVGLLAAGCLVRVELWPFALGAALVHGRTADPRERAVLLGGAAAILAAWFVPEWLSSGDPLRSGARARIPTPGQPALAAVPALASLIDALELLFVPAAIGTAVLAIRRERAALVPAALGLAWIALVALMAQAGFSGEARYALPGAALVAVSGAVGLTRLPVVPVLLVVVIAATLRIAGLVDDHRALSYQQALRTDLSAVIEGVGGRDALLRRGRPVAGPLRGTLVAWHLDVAKEEVGFRAGPGTIVLQSRLREGDPRQPPMAPGARIVARNRTWRVGVS